MDEGVLVLLEGGVYALSGETGEELWFHYESDEKLASNITDNGRYVVLHGRESSRMILLQVDSGEIAYEYTLDMSEFAHTYRVRSDHVHDALGGITGQSWVVRWQDTVSSYGLDTGEELWSASDVARCPHQGSVDSMSVQDDVVVAATTCYEQPEDRDTEWVVGWDFTSDLVGLDTRTGEELWRVEHTLGRQPGESLQRDLVSLSVSGVLVSYLDSHDLESFLDIETAEATQLESGNLLWTSSDGSQLGLWDTETGEYRIQDRAGNVERTLERDEVSMRSDMVTKGHRVGLEGGVLYLEDWMEDASVPEGFARFEGFDGSSVLTWDKAESLRVTDALSVPGGVAVAYRADGKPGVMGLR